VLSIWTLTLKNNIDQNIPSHKKWSFMRYTCIPNIKSLSLLVQKDGQSSIFCPQRWPWPWHTPQNVRLHEIHVHAEYQVFICTGSNVIANVKIADKHLTYDLDLSLSPLKMCIFMRCTYMPIIKCLSLLIQKLWQMVKSVIWPIFFTLKDDLDSNM